MTPRSLALGVIFVVCVEIFFLLLAILTYKCQHRAIHENLDLENQISGGDVEADHVVQQDLENQISGGDVEADHVVQRDLENQISGGDVVADHIVQSLDKTSRPITSETNIVWYKKEGDIKSRCNTECLEELKDDDSCSVLPNCGHMYHQVCIDQ
ncbi:hypothetical protein V6N13_133698 [Hibiscus sabdariffa]|uniref:RING-type domain-containing protein n=1 Tax=Hibiscus sabdariffa TaxID=183260 RepID=A0ABR2R0X5_9ROSI